MKPHFPAPTYFGRRRAYQWSKVLGYEYALRGEVPPAINPTADHYLSARQVCERLGVSDMWLWRREAERKAALGTE